MPGRRFMEICSSGHAYAMCWFCRIATNTCGVSLARTACFPVEHATGYGLKKSGSLSHLTILVRLELHTPTKTTAQSVESFHGFGDKAILL